MMYKAELFKSKVQEMAERLKSQSRGPLPADIEAKIVSELESIFIRMADKFSSSQPTVHGLVGLKAMADLIERMELDFSQKFALDFQHGIEKGIEVGKIKIVFLDGVRRILTQPEILA